MNINFNQKLKNIAQELESEGHVFIDGITYRKLLISHGAQITDLEVLESGLIHNEVEQDTEPNMHFRQVAFHRVLIDDRTKALTQANHPAITQISEKEIASDKGAKVFFKRHGTRQWNLPPKKYSESSVAKAIGKINSKIVPNNHHKQDNLNNASNVTINDQILIRINKVIDLAEPTPEGIHQDGTEISSISLIQRCNVSHGGESRIWNLSQPTGNYSSNEFGKLCKGQKISTPKGFDWKNCLMDRALLNKWDTIILNDRKVKHEARDFFNNTNEPCYRDVLVNFIRKPLLDGSDKMEYNNETLTIY